MALVTQPSLWPLALPNGYRGPVTLRSGREVFFTGKVAIGLRYRQQSQEQPSESQQWLQELLLKAA